MIPGIIFLLALFSALVDPRVGLGLFLASLLLLAMQFAVNKFAS